MSTLSLNFQLAVNCPNDTKITKIKASKNCMTKYLNISGCSNVGGLPKMPRLETLNIDGTRIHVLDINLYPNVKDVSALSPYLSKVILPSVNKVERLVLPDSHMYTIQGTVNKNAIQLVKIEMTRDYHSSNYDSDDDLCYRGGVNGADYSDDAEYD